MNRYTHLFLVFITIFLILILIIHLIFDNLTIGILLFCIFLLVTVHKYRLLVQLLLAIIIISLFFYLILETTPRQPQKQHLDDQKYTFNYSYPIFFMQSHPRRKVITTKETCAIESAAKNNPKALVLFFRGSTKSDQLVRQLRKAYSNLRIHSFHPESVFAETPLILWWTTKVLNNSNFSYSHLIDAYKIAMMWKYGGVYSDLDTITLKSFEILINEQKSGFGQLIEESAPSIGLGVLVFRPHHPFIGYLMTKLASRYDPEENEANRTEFFVNSIKNYCKIDDLSSLTRPRKTHPCADLVIFPQNYFYPFTLKEDFHLSIMRRNSNLNYGFKMAVKYSFSMHYFGELSSHLRPRPDDNSFFAHMVSMHCPITNSFVKDYSLEFY